MSCSQIGVESIVHCPNGHRTSVRQATDEEAQALNRLVQERSTRQVPDDIKTVANQQNEVLTRRAQGAEKPATVEPEGQCGANQCSHSEIILTNEGCQIECLICGKSQKLAEPLFSL